MRSHAVRIAIWWVVITVILEVLVAVLPIPSPIGSDEALGEHQTMYMLFYVAVPFFAFIWAMLIHIVLTFRGKPGDEGDGPPLKDSTPVLLLWAADKLRHASSSWPAGVRSYLHEITTPDGGKPMHIQVIGQQWFWTYRYPVLGGMESRVLYLPVHRSDRV